MAKEESRLNPQEIRYQAAHSYPGNDPSVLKLLDSLYLENYPIDDVEFGPLIQLPSRRQPIQRFGGQQASGPWRPEGTLIAMLGEHTACINRVVVAPDHAFFITGSDDGTVKVWDTSRLERNIAHRSRQTHKHGQTAKITALCFVENRHTFVSAASDGSINVVRVDYTQDSHGASRYGKLRLVREHYLPAGQFAVWLEHRKVDSQSILLIATNKSQIIALELRTMTTLYVLQNPLHHGTPTCFCLDRRHHWLLLGTSHGVLDLWDLRFRLRLKAWGFAGGAPVHRICLPPIRSESKRLKVIVAGGTGTGEVTVWDLEKGVCKEIWRTGGSREGTKGWRLLDIDDEKSAGGMLDRFATAALEPGTGSSSSGAAGADRGVRAMAMGAHVAEDGSRPKFYYFVTAGPDWKVRFWDSARYDASCVVSGLELDEGKPSYVVSQPGAEMYVIQEKLAPAGANAAGGNASASGGSERQRERANSGRAAGGERPSAARRASTKTGGRSSLVSSQQQHLLKSHLDTVVDVALLEFPFGMVVSVDRAGVVLVFS